MTVLREGFRGVAPPNLVRQMTLPVPCGARLTLSGGHLISAFDRNIDFPSVQPKALQVCISGKALLNAFVLVI